MGIQIQLKQIKNLIEDVVDYPKKGIIFKDITPLLNNHEGLTYTTEVLAESFVDAGATTVVGIEARGFIFGPLVARILGVGFVPLRKPGKLPRETLRISYELEYGNAELEVHTDALSAGDSALIIDDVLATGGTAAASIELVERAKATVCGLAFAIELTELGGRNRLVPYRTHSVLQY